MLHRCPECGLAGIKARKRLTPRFKCYKCTATFDVPISRTEPVTAFRSEHDVGWVDLPGLLSGPDLRALCVHPASQLSIRPLRWNDFVAAVSRTSTGEVLTPLRSRAGRLAGGHKNVAVRIRLGQAELSSADARGVRGGLRFTGPAPLSTLEACHLYSYAESACIMITAACS